jgi:REP-associated tyrosine transposase
MRWRCHIVRRANASPLRMTSYHNDFHCLCRKTMKFDPDRHHRRSIRLPGYDYSQPGTYFITICTYQREYTLSTIHNRTVNLSPTGQVVERYWRVLPERFLFIELDTFVIMPNHLHGIIVINDRGSWDGTSPDGRQPSLLKGTQSGSLAALIQNFKSVSTRKINQSLQSRRTPVWQRGYYERVIRDEAEWNSIRQYIEANPERWANKT